MFVRIQDTLVNFDYVIWVDPIYEEEEYFYLQMGVLSNEKHQGKRYRFLDRIEAQEMYDMLEEKLCQST